MNKALYSDALVFRLRGMYINHCQMNFQVYSQNICASWYQSDCTYGVPSVVIMFIQFISWKLTSCY